MCFEQSEYMLRESACNFKESQKKLKSLWRLHENLIFCLQEVGLFGALQVSLHSLFNQHLNLYTISPQLNSFFTVPHLYFGSGRNVELLYWKSVTASSLHMCFQATQCFLLYVIFCSYCFNKLTIMYFFASLSDICDYVHVTNLLNEVVRRLTDPK